MRRSRQDWLDYIERADVSERVREVLRHYAQARRNGRLLSRPQAEVAAELGISTRMVRKHLTTAMQAGLIVEVIRAQRGLTAVYEGTFGTPAAMAEQAELFWPFSAQNRGVPAMRPTGFEGSTQYYGQHADGGRAARRRELTDSFFTDPLEGESVTHFSLPLIREEVETDTCRQCGGPLDERSIRFDHAVGDCCALVVGVETEGTHVKGETA